MLIAPWWNEIMAPSGNENEIFFQFASEIFKLTGLGHILWHEYVHMQHPQYLPGQGHGGLN